MAQIDFTGNLGRDAELRYTKAGDPVLSFNVADSKSKKLDNGKWETTAEQWLRVTVWGSYAEYLAEHLTKGVRVRVFGEFMSRTYEDKDGTERLSLDVTAQGVHVVNKPRRDDSPAPQQGGGWGQQEDPWN